MDNKKNIFLYLIIGDAFATPFDNLKRAHINSTIKEINGYTDASPALKDRPEKWRKPGLYSSISQFAILAAMSFINGKFNIDKFKKIIELNPQIQEGNYGIFRNPGRVEASFLHGITETQGHVSLLNLPCARLIPMSTPFSLEIKDKPGKIAELISFLLLFTTDTSTIAGCMIYQFLLNYYISNNNYRLENIIDASIMCIKEIITLVDSNPGQIFKSGVNPDSLLNQLDDYKQIFELILNEKNKGNAEEKICLHVNRTLKTQIKKATVNIPRALIPYTFFLIRHYSNQNSNFIFNIPMEGGNVSVIASITCPILASANLNLPENLVNELMNKKRISKISEKLNNTEIQFDSVKEFLDSEKSLTLNEQMELNSKLKHSNRKKPKKKPATNSLDELTKHAVESWTKIDKANWKKEKKKINRENY